jgi:DNA-binding NarL/FixJ family response regulator
MGPRSPKDVEVELLEIGGERLAILTFPSERTPEGLSPAELEILRLLRKGMSNAEIARARATSVRTVANQVASLLRRFGVASRHELLIAIAAQE